MASRRQKAETTAGKKTPAPTPSSAAPAPASTAGPKIYRGQKLSYKEERELEGIEAAVMAAEEEATAAEELLNSPDLYKKTPAEISHAQSEAVRLRNMLGELYNRWDLLEKKKAASNPA
jgi:ATP-binding cassette subfamily F protein uup